jgi:uncharacterized protein (TIGR00251 family)
MSGLPGFLQVRKEGIVLSVQVQPGAKKSELIGPTPDNFLKIKIAAPAVENKANEKLISFLSDYLDVRKSEIEIIHGQASRRKKILVKAIPQEQVLAKLKF